jgi:hypothetical protein
MGADLTPQRHPGVALRQGQGQSLPVRLEPVRLLGGTPAMAVGARGGTLRSRLPAPAAGEPVRGLQDGLRSGPRAVRQHQHRGAPRPRHRRLDPASRPPLVPPRAADAVDLDNAGGCLSRMRGDPPSRRREDDAVSRTHTTWERGLSGPAEPLCDSLSVDVICHWSLAACWAAMLPLSGTIFFKNLKRSLSVERIRGAKAEFGG